MKKLVIVLSMLSIFLFLSCNLNTITAIAEIKSFTQGFYDFKDTGLVTDYAYKIKNSSPTGKAVVIVFDSNQMMEEFIRLEPNSPDYILKPFDYGYILIIIGGGSIAFS